MQRIVLLAASIALVTGIVPAGAAQSDAPVDSTPAGPVFNPTFELGPAETPAHSELEGTAADHCFGVGHQVFWGSDTPQGKATGGQLNPYALDPSGAPDPSEADPDAAAHDVQEDPEGEALFLAGQDSCVYGDDTGYDLAWIQPVDRSQQPAHWSMDVRDPSVDFGYGHDDDPMDREAKILADASKANHNMWQWFGSPHQAWTPNAEALTLDLETNDAPSSASIKISLSTIPDESTGPGGYYTACTLSFSGDLLNQHADADGHVEVSPLEASFTAGHSSCAPLVAQWENGDDEAKRDALGQTRITQVSFWGWNHGDDPVVVDDVQIEGATTYAEQTAKDAAEAVETPSAHGNTAGLLVCSGHTGDDWSAGARLDLAHAGLDLVVPAPEDAQAEAVSLATHLAEHGTVGNSVTHASATHNGDEAAGAGTDDIPGLTEGNGGGDGGWTCGDDGTQHPDDGGGAPAKPYDNAAEAADDLLP